MNREVTDRKVCTAKSDVDSMEAGGLPLRAVGTRLFRSVPPRSAGGERLVTALIRNPLPDVGSHVIQTIDAALGAPDRDVCAPVIVHSSGVVGNGIRVRAPLDEAIGGLVALFCIRCGAPLGNGWQPPAGVAAVGVILSPSDVDSWLGCSAPLSLRIRIVPARPPRPTAGILKTATLALSYRRQRL